jgi:hypothetical protein
LTPQAVNVTSFVLGADDIFWTRGSIPNGIETVPLAGGSQTFLFKEPENGVGVSDVAFDGVYVYWIENRSAGHREQQQAIYGVDRGGGTPVLIAGPTNDIPTDGNNLAIDGSNVYWANTTGEIKKAPKTGAGPTATVASGPGYPYSMILRGTRIVWAAGYDIESIVEAQTTGGQARVITTANVPSGVVASPIAADDACVYWFDHTQRTLMKAPL